MWSLLSVALAAMPPEVDLNDVERWEIPAERLLELPRGCWEWVGEARWDWDVGRWGGSRGTAVFAGRTVDGVWGSVLLKPLGEIVREGRDPEKKVYDAKEARFAPLVGRFQGARVTVAGPDGSAEKDKNKTEADLGENAEAANVLRIALDRLGGDAYSSYASWDEERGGVVLHRAVSLAEKDTQQIEFAVFFPSGDTQPSSLELTFPAVFRTGRLPRWTIRDGQVHIRGTISGGQVFPTAEAFSFGFGFLGFRFHGAQTVKYRKVSRCASPVTEGGKPESGKEPPAPVQVLPVPVPVPEPAPEPAPVPVSPEDEGLW
jgi:hypothetical protein